MTGLILKDFLVLRKAILSYVVVIAIYAVLAFFDIFQFSFIISFLQIMLMVMPLSAFAFDEQAKWDRYAMSLPIGRSAVVRARYLFVVLLSLLILAIGLASAAVLWIARLEDPVEFIMTALVTAAIGLLIPSILLPLSYKLGAERARPYLYAIVFIPAVAIMLLAKADLIDLSMLDWLNGLSPAALLGGTSLLPLGALAVLGVSCLISCRVVAGKEY